MGHIFPLFSITTLQIDSMLELKEVAGDAPVTNDSVLELALEAAQEPVLLEDVGR